MTDEELEAVRDVASGGHERICKPGKWRVYRDEAGRVIFERFADV